MSASKIWVNRLSAYRETPPPWTGGRAGSNICSRCCRMASPGPPSAGSWARRRSTRSAWAQPAGLVIMQPLPSSSSCSPNCSSHCANYCSNPSTVLPVAPRRPTEIGPIFPGEQLGALGRRGRLPLLAEHVRHRASDASSRSATGAEGEPVEISLSAFAPVEPSRIDMPSAPAGKAQTGSAYR